jgi:CheY-like chemotaxis protein
VFDSPVKLLIVDDDVSIRDSLPPLFSELGYCVRSVKDGVLALSEIGRDLPDILLSDLNIPGMSGVEFLLVVRRLYPSIRVIAMSGRLFDNCVPPGIAADAFFEEGADMADLIESVDGMTRAERPAKRLSMEDLFGFPMFETIPPRPGAGRLANSVCQTNYQFLASQRSQELGFS